MNQTAQNPETFRSPVQLLRFGERLSVAVVGAGGGIGAALVRQLAESPQVAHVFALSRNPPAPKHAKVQGLVLDYDRPETITAAAEVIAGRGRLDLVIVATGHLHDGPDHQPEKDWRHLKADAMRRSFDVNTIGPSLVAQAFLPLMPKDGHAVFAILGARVGSISDNRIGGWYGYRASKAALAMIVKCLAIELKRKRRATVCVALHPGTVDTALSQPFQANTPGPQIVMPDVAAAHLLKVIADLKDEDSGTHIAWDGEPIPP